jgi:3-oxoadipate enol-lactonase
MTGIHGVHGPLYYERMGRTGPVMAFMPPNPMDQACWTYQMQHFSTWFRCVAIDTPGYGRSPSADDGINAHEIGEAFWSAVDEVDPEGKAVLVGCSGGFMYSLIMQHLRPERTAAVVLCGAGYTDPSLTMRRHDAYQEQGVSFRWQHTFLDFSPAFNATPMSHYIAEIFRERNSLLDVETIKRQYRALAAGDPTLPSTGGLPETWLDVKAPSLILTGTEDAQHQGSFVLNEKISGSELHILPGAGHACQIEQPWLFDNLLIAFLEKHGLMRRAEPAT